DDPRVMDAIGHQRQGDCRRVRTRLSIFDRSWAAHLGPAEAGHHVPAVTLARKVAGSRTEWHTVAPRREIMQSRIWRRCAVGVFVLASAALGAAQQTANDPSPLALPGHRYDLPATLITAAQIDA